MTLYLRTYIYNSCVKLLEFFPMKNGKWMYNLDIIWWNQ